MGKALTVRRFATTADAEVDEVLLALWDMGFDDVDDPDDVVPRKAERGLSRALGLQNPQEETRVNYWLERTGLTRAEFALRLSEVSITLSPQARVLPKGALKKVRRMFAPVAAAPAEAAEEPCPPFDWTTVGFEPVQTFLSEEDVRSIHNALVADFAAAADPISPPGVRDENMLGSAVQRPMTSMGDVYKYTTVEMAGAALLHSLVLNLIRPGFRAGPRPLKEDESYEYGCEVEAADPAPVLAGVEGAGGADGAATARGDGREARLGEAGCGSARHRRGVAAVVGASG